MDFTEKTLSSESLYQGRIVKLSRDQVELTDGRVTTREVIDHPGGVGILALDGQNRLLMVRQFRYPFQRMLLEIPAGKLEPGEDPAACGRRELEEETGCQAGRYEPLGQLIPTPAYDKEVIHLYLARDLRPTRQHLDEGEFLSVEAIPFDRVVELILDGQILDAKTQVAVLKAKAMRDLGRL